MLNFNFRVILKSYIRVFIPFIVLSLILMNSVYSDSNSCNSRYDDHPGFFPTSDLDNVGHWRLLQPLSDEFTDQDLDAAKWERSFPGWDGRFPSWFVPANVYLEDGKLNIIMKKEHLPEMGKGCHYSTGILRSKSAFLYGYAEIKAQCMNSAGSSSFFLNNVQADWWTEIDIFEIGGKALGHERLVHTNFHEFYNPANVQKPYTDNPATHYSDTRAWTAPWRPADGYHIYGCEWDAKTISWFVDGALIRAEHNTRWHQEQYLNLDSEVMQDWWGLPRDKDLPSVYSVEYVRVWQKCTF